MTAARFEVRRRGDAAVLAASGEVDLGAVDAFREARAEALATDLPVIVDLTPCDFIDSTGISCVIRTFQDAERAGRPFALVGSGPEVKRVLELVDIRRLVPTFGSLDDALEHVAGQR